MAATKKGVRDFMSWQEGVQEGMGFIDDHCLIRSPAETMTCDVTPPSGVTIEWYRDTMRKWHSGPEVPADINIKCVNVDQAAFGPGGIIVNRPPNPKQWARILALPD